jgi:hypothetical protein
MTTALLVHSPLVGPATMRPLGAALRALGWTSVVPDLRGAIADPATFATAAAAATDVNVDVVVGHSGAGAVLPVAVEHVGARVAVFVDAILPDAASSTHPSTRFLALLDTIPTSDGALAPWHTWWPADALRELLPADEARETVIGEIPAVPRSFYDQEIALPPSWWTRPAAYLQLSPAYDEELGRATAWGWPTRAVAGGHLDVVVHPNTVAGHVASLAVDAAVLGH